MKTYLTRKSILSLGVSAVLGLNLLTPAVTLAQYVGGTQTKQISINKQVKNPVNGAFVENIDSNTYVFLTNQAVVYQIEVSNTGSVTLNNIQVQDSLPGELRYVSSEGSYDQNSRNITLNIGSLNPSQTKTFVINASVAVATTKGGAPIASCPINRVVVKVDEITVSDQSIICVGEKILSNVKILPATGPAQPILGFTVAIVTLLSSAILFRKSTSIRL